MGSSIYRQEHPLNSLACISNSCLPEVTECLNDERSLDYFHCSAKCKKHDESCLKECYHNIRSLPLDAFLTCAYHENHCLVQHDRVPETGVCQAPEWNVGSVD